MSEQQVMVDPQPKGREASDGSVASLVLISPCRDEARYCRTTIESVLAQTVRPAQWAIVDDGSTDKTPTILAEYAAEHEWITVVRRKDRGRRAVGPGVVDAFYAGLATIDLDQFDYLCKLDLDVELPARYFETLIERMQAQPRLGTCSGKPYLREPESGRLLSERIGDEMSAGMTKFYRTTCFRDIGGFVREVSWDGIDCHYCRMKGWIAQSWDEPELRFMHLRQMGASHKGIWTGRIRWGRGKRFMGSSPLYALAVSVFRAVERPMLIGGLGILVGYFDAMVRRLPRYQDPEYRAFLRRYEHCSLLFGKRRTMERYHARILETEGRANG